VGNRELISLKKKTISRSLALFVALTLLLSIDAGWAIDMADLGKVLKTMPANGPFWKYGNVVMKRRSKKAGMAPVVFPHWVHRARYTCRVCHMELEFSMRSGGTGITRKQYLAGNFCGACHDGKTAFSVRDGDSPQCVRCHLKDSTPLEKRFAAFAATMPSSSFGNGIDWLKAINTGQITPKNSILTSSVTMELPEKLSGPLKLGSAYARSVVPFSHQDNFYERDCSNCHPDIFNIKKKGTEDFSMKYNIYGNFCGACHMRVAFPMDDCRRCHPEMSNKKSGY